MPQPRVQIVCESLLSPSCSFIRELGVRYPRVDDDRSDTHIEQQTALEQFLDVQGCQDAVRQLVVSKLYLNGEIEAGVVVRVYVEDGRHWQERGRVEIEVCHAQLLDQA